ncbi:hypothetical protein RhiirC2_797363 [Rhizophagus irregularis]|uniref:Uncharacterized protein n=1 Tax=Rhizophagus irregularis TaxID=588596 RepID=A0A2N1M848_9GLOM|nr:hypothetical protein RhiirC2_797363 [Rhizophagus irregularis]
MALRRPSRRFSLLGILQKLERKVQDAAGLHFEGVSRCETSINSVGSVEISVIFDMMFLALRFPYDWMEFQRFSALQFPYDWMEFQRFSALQFPYDWMEF